MKLDKYRHKRQSTMAVELGAVVSISCQVVRNRVRVARLNQLRRWIDLYPGKIEFRRSIFFLFLIFNSPRIPTHRHRPRPA